MDTSNHQPMTSLPQQTLNPLITTSIQETFPSESIKNTDYNQIIENKKINEEKNNSGNNGRWEHKEHLRFLGGCLQFGNNWKKVETYVKTRTSTQIRSHAQKYLNKLQKKYFNNGSFSFSNLNNSKNIESASVENTNDEINNENIGGMIEYNGNAEKIIDIHENDIKMDKRYKINEEKLKQLLVDLTKPDFDIEIVEKIILKIFCFHKKYDNSIYQDNNYGKPLSIKKIYGKYVTKNDTPKKNKTIFFCQKLKKEPNYEKQVKDMLDSNDQQDLQKLFCIYQAGNNGKEDPSYKIMMSQLEEFDY